ncbi:hypothetical protein VR7878_00993 [Vibrio ruber DSM 16370]|uniref:DUF6603 domain-containing protein n=1 Tax=Vibrio ruber (strain DSM 16370 / JCM 11486 / BCRC 17186 / CECT 7878 / LMG 23124 / VR1) TaxID=1123498 RepID=A0A1R4LEC0_VIBR1|nr:DUF6603 domain-containing protein [Vibrio ruber]SJN54921.1 hypothetical protein VR7878_00993 [Vibrio ruber DSM 16370]
MNQINPVNRAFEPQTAPVSFSGIDPILSSLGVLVGLLESQGEERFALVPEWFTDPYTQTKAGIVNHPEEFNALFEALLGEIGGNAFGIPIQNPALLGNWYPIRYEKAGQDVQTGVNVVLYQVGSATVFALGVYHDWSFGTPATLQAAVWGVMPFVAIDPKADDPIKITFVTPGFPIVAGASVTGADPDKPMIDINDIQFNGVKINLNTDFAVPDPFSLGVEIVGLQLAGETTPSNRSLADLEAITAEQIMDTVASLFVGGLSEVFPNAKDNIAYFPPLFGLSGRVPDVEGAPQATIPLLKWYDLLSAARQGQAGQLFLDWFNAIASDHEVLKTWLSCFSGFLFNRPQVIGSGTRTDPFRITALEVDSIGTLQCTLGTDVTGQSARALYFGIDFSGTPIPLQGADMAFVLQARAELVNLQLTGPAPGLSDAIQITAQFCLQNTTLASPLVTFESNDIAYSIGTLQGGVTLSISGQMMPWFELNQVIIGETHYDTLNLLSPGQLANAGAAALSTGLQSLLNFGTDNQSLSDSLATMIGLNAPVALASQWPEQLTPPFSPAGMADALADPIGAWADYYSHVLTYQPLIDGKQAFTYIVQSLATLLKSATDTTGVTVTGTGTSSDPWQAGISVSDLALPAYLTGYYDDAARALTLGASLAPEIKINSTVIVAALEIDAVTIRFGTGQDSIGTVANWFAGATARLSLPDGLETPAVGGMQVKVDSAQLSACWQQSGGWSWSMCIHGPALVVDGQVTALGSDLNFSDQSSLQDLVTQSQQTFGPFFISALGAMLMRSQSETGLWFAGTFGLVTDLSASPVFPTSGLTWSGFEPYPFHSFDTPWPDLNQQLEQLLSTDEKSRSTLGLLAWAMTDQPAAPAIAGQGTFTEPWQTPIGESAFYLPVWSDRTQHLLGAGLGRQQTFQLIGTGESKVDFALDIRLNLFEYSMATRHLSSLDSLPSLICVGTLSRPDGKLVDLGSVGSAGAVQLGFSLRIVSSTLVFEPVVSFTDITLGESPPQDTVTLQMLMNGELALNLESAFLALLNGAIQEAVQLTSVTDDTQFQTLYRLLTLLGLTLTRDTEQAAYGINASGWQGLLADPTGYMQDNLNRLLTEPASRSELFDFIQSVTGVTLPTLPVPAYQFLSALQICGSAAQGYPLNPQALLEIASNPVRGLSSRFEALFTDVDAVTTLAAQISSNITPQTYGKFTFSTTANGLVSLTVMPEQAFDIAGLLQLDGGLTFNLSDQTLVLAVNAAVPKLGLTLVTRLQLRMAQGQLQPPDLSIQLVWGNGLTPAAEPLVLYPFVSDMFVDQVAHLAPAYTLNLLLNAVFEDELLDQYEVIQKLFTGLGLAKNEDGLWQMPSLMGLLTDPLGWLLSDEVLGDNGQFSTAKLVALLGDLPALSYQGIQLTPVPDSGATLSGLPFDFKVQVSGQDQRTTLNIGVDQIEIVDHLAALKNLQLCLTLDQQYQPAFSGGLDLEATIAALDHGFFTRIAFDKTFALQLSQGTPEQPTGLGVQFLPFLGWGTLATQALATGAVVVIQEVIPKLIAQMKSKYAADTSAGQFFRAMETFAQQTDVSTLVDHLVQDFTTAVTEGQSQADLLNTLEVTAFDWVSERFSESGAPHTAQAIVALLSLVLPEDAIEAVDGQIQYIPSETLPLKLLFGYDSSNAIGVWAGFDLPDVPLLKMQVAPTGVAYSLTDQTLTASFGLEMIAPIETLNGPGLSLSYTHNQFEFRFDPLADPEKPGEASALSVTLLPAFFGGGDDVGDKVTAWLMDVIKDVLPRYVSLLTLNQETVKSWLETPFNSGTEITPVLLLTATQVVAEQSDLYVLRSFDELTQITAQSFFGGLLFTLLEKTWTLLEFGQNGKLILGPKTDVDGYYGLLLQAPDLTLKAVPNLVFQLGAENTDWITQSSSGTPAFGDKGIGLYVPVSHSGDDFSVAFEQFNLVLNNVGFDIVGQNAQPIVDLSRFKLGQIEPRALFAMQFQGSSSIDMTFGVGLTLDEMGISLAPTLISEGGGNNPIAKNVLGSGEKQSASAETDTSTTDPRFSVDIGYLDKLWVNLRSPMGNGHDVIIPVQRSFGPLYIDNVGIGWEGENTPPLLDFLSSGSFEISGLTAAMQGLRVGVPVTHPTDWNQYTIDLDGFAIDYTGGVTIDAGFLKEETDGIVSYTGVGIVSSGKFSLGALGSYAQIQIDGQEATSMFIFGVLNAPLGGVPAFFIEGIAAGFAYNRSLEIPSIEEVANFPLVKGVADGSFTEGEDPMAALTQLNQVVTPQVGQYWFAAGLKFSSFKLIDTTALLFLSFGKDFEFNLLGVSVATLPPKAKPNLALAYMELALKVTINPNAGYVSAEAQLTPNSYVLAQGVKVTGGFAFYLWFKDVTLADGTLIPAGDFVLTLGGYHPAFQKPVYYPDVPRLGIQWKLDFSVGKVSITGGAYFAICPTAIMSGGYLTVAFDAGPLVAGLDAYANFLLQWQPFYFNVGIGVSVYAGFETSIAGVSVRLVAKLGCQLKLHGPPVFGSVDVDWYVIRFSIPIGNQDNHPSTQVLDWAAFEQEFLPSGSGGQTTDVVTSARLSATAVSATATQEVVKWTAQKGLQQDSNTNPDAKGDGAWVMNPIPWQITVESAIPVSELTVTQSDTTLSGSVAVGVRPMGKEDTLSSPMTVTLTDSSGTEIDLKERNIALTGANNGAPSALWARSALNLNVAPDPKTMLIENVLFGLVLNASQYIYDTVIPTFPLENLAYVSGDTKRLPFAFTPKIPAAALYPESRQQQAFTVIRETLMAAVVVTARNDIYQALQASGIDAPLSPGLSVMAASVSQILQDFPVLAKIGIYQNNGVPEAGNPIAAQTHLQSAAPATETMSVTAPTVIAQLQAYQVPAKSVRASQALATLRSKSKGHWQVSGAGVSATSCLKSQGSATASVHRLYEGTTLVVKTDPAQSLRVHAAGNLAVLIVSFDTYGSLLGFDVCPAAGDHTLPKETARVVVQGVSDGSLSDAVGWQVGSQLSKVSGNWTLGDGCLVRVQNSRQITSATGSIGHVKVSDMLANNTVLSMDRQSVKGWVQTVFDSEIRVVGVLLKGKVSDDAIQVTVGADEVPTKSGDSQPLTVKDYHGNTLFLFRVPDTVRDYSGTLVRWVDQQAVMLGMYGLNQDGLQQIQQCPRLALSQVGMDVYVATLPETTIQFIPG